MPRLSPSCLRKGGLTALALGTTLILSTPAQAIAPAVLLMGLGTSILDEVVKEVKGEAEKSVTTWVTSSLGLEEKPQEDPRIQATIDTIKQMDKKLDLVLEKLNTVEKQLADLIFTVDVGFLRQKCDMEKQQLKSLVSQVKAQHTLLLGFLDPQHRRSWKDRVEWARSVTKPDGLYQTLENIHDNLTGSNSPDQQQGGLYGSCGTLLLTHWREKGVLANERSYYDPLLSMQSFYYAVQAAGIRVAVSAFQVLATNEARKEGKEIRSKGIAKQVCGNYLQKVETLTKAEGLCLNAHQLTEKIHSNITAQFKQIGAGYSYHPDQPDQAANISALNPSRMGEKQQLWVLNPELYPNDDGTGGTTAYATSRLLNDTYAGMKGWRGAGGSGASLLGD